jgi:hypothetical protein
MAKQLTPTEMGEQLALTVQKLVEKRGAKLDKEAMREMFKAFAKAMMVWLLMKRL